jgi:hypothetical protein
VSSANLTLVVCSLFILGLAFLFGHLRWLRIDVVDIYVLIVSIFFGGYTLVNALAKDLSMVNPVLAALVLMLVVATLGITWLVSRMLPIGLQRALQIRYLLSQWLRVDGKVILLLLGGTILFQLYSYLRFGFFASHDLFRFRADDLALEGISFPYWFTSVAFLMTFLIPCVFIAVTTKALTSSAATRGPWIVALVTMMLVASLYGRRMVFYLIFVFLILWCLVRGKNLFTLRTGLLVLIVLPILVAISNIYLVYRPAAQQFQATNPDISVPAIYAAATNMDTTVSNLQERPAIWQLNYTILDKQIQHHGLSIPYGDLLWQGFRNTIPNAFWPGKSVYNLDDMVAHLYGMPARDYGTNNFAMSQADFGLLSVILLPLASLLVFLSMALLILATRRHPTLLLLLSGFFIFYLLNVEVDYGHIFVLYRNILTVMFIYFVAYILAHPQKRVRLYNRKQLALPRPATGPQGDGTQPQP